MVQTLIDQLCVSIKEWSRTTGANAEELIGIIMLWTGGEAHVKGDGALSDEELKRIAPGKVRGIDHY